ncbi:DNA polymerase III subunit gamma and tau, partial [Streptomyces sp900105755]
VGGGTRRPGGWPTASGGAAAAPAPQQAPQPSAVPAAAPAPAPAAAAPAGGLDPRVLWPNILEAVKNRRRFTWILLSQNAQVVGFDGTTLQIGFVNAGARDNFASSGSEDVLRQALGEQFGVQWRIEAVVDPTGGGGAAPPAGYGAAPAAPARPAPVQQAPAAAAPAQSPPPPAPRATAPAPAPSAPEPPPVSPEDDIPEEDDPDLDESALSGHELIVKELGATVVEEIQNE